MHTWGRGCGTQWGRGHGALEGKFLILDPERPAWARVRIRANPCSGRGSFPRLRKDAMQSPEPHVPQQPYQAVARAPTVTGTQTPSGRGSPRAHARPRWPPALFASAACTPSP